MNLEHMLEIQAGMDAKFEKKSELHRKGCLWLITEISELANEWGGFKYRHPLQDLNRNRMLEEYVDGLAVLMSLGLFHSFFPLKGGVVETTELHKSGSLVNHFLKLIGDAVRLYRWEMKMNDFSHFFRRYLALGDMLGFRPEEIERAYIQKQEKNRTRMWLSQDESLLQPAAEPVPGPGPIQPMKPPGMA